MGTKVCANIFRNLQVQASSRFRNNLPLILREYWSERTCIFQVLTHKVPIEEMTDRWETENPDGWQSMDYYAIRILHLRGRITLSKKQKLAIWYFSQIDLHVDLQTCRLYGRHTYELYSLIAHKLDKPPYCLSMLWQSHQLQTTNWNIRLVFFWTQQGMFWVTQNLSGYSRKPATFRELPPPKSEELVSWKFFLSKYYFIFE